MSIVRWEPFRDVERAMRRAERVFGRWPRIKWEDIGEEGMEWAPAADISETDKEYVIKAELPEVKKEDVSVTVTEGVITIAGERKQEKEKKDEKVHRVERFYGSFYRSFDLPEDADDKNIRAESKDGVLTVRIPKLEGAKKPKAVQVEVH
jgi:HSP20 family protein